METEVLKEKLIQYLEERELRYIERGDKISHACISPDHIETNPSAFTMLNDESFTYCSSCGFHLNTEKLHQFLDVGFDPDSLFISKINSMLKSLDKSNVKDNEKSVPIYLPIEDKEFRTEYRGISPETFEKVRAFSTIPDTYYARRIIFPIHNIDNELVGFEAVSTNKKIVPKILRPRGNNTIELFGFENFIDSDTVFITEGIFSALSFIELGYSSVFNFGVGSIKPKIKKLMLKGVRNVIIAGDADKVGKNFNKECYQVLKRNFNVSYFQYPYEFKDINKFDSNDLLKEYGKEAMIKYISKFLEKNLIF